MASGQEENPPVFKNSCLRRTIKLSYLVGSITTVVVSALLVSYLFAYPFRSNVCNGLSGEGTLSGDTKLVHEGKDFATRCAEQVTARGYKSTNDLVHGELLPPSWAKNVAAQGATPDYRLCQYNTLSKECEEAEPDAAECFSDKDDKGRRKNRWGNDGKCEALKAPEICRQTGFDDALTKDKQEELAIVGANAEVAGVVLLVTLILGILQFLNYHWGWLGCKGIEGVCEAFGKPCGLDIGAIIPGMCVGIKACSICCKHNLKEDANETVGLKLPYEAATIFFSFFVHNVLILVFGQVGIQAKAHIDKNCYEATNVDGCDSADANKPNCVYTGTVEEYIKSLKGSSGNLENALQYFDQRGSLADAAIVFWWINLIAAGIQLASWLVSHGNSADMDLVAIRSSDDLNPFKNIGASEDNAIGIYQKVSQEEIPTRRRVQLRGQF